VFTARKRDQAVAEIGDDDDVVVCRPVDDGAIDVALHVRRQRLVVHEVDLEQLAHIRGIDETAFQRGRRADPRKSPQADIWLETLADQVVMGFGIADAGDDVHLLAK
jgi:hypothetical protein